MIFKFKFISFLPFLIAFSFACNKKEGIFQSLPSSKTNISFQNNLVQKDGFGILYYIYYYNGGGVATGDVNNDGLTDIYFTANSKGNNKLYLNKGNFEFEDITETAGVAGSADWCSGVTMADVNADGFLDIYVSVVSQVHELSGHNKLYINNGITPSPDGEGRGEVSFTESAAAYGLDFSGLSTQAAFFDYDRDGDLDCYLLNHSQRPHENIVDTSNRKRYDTLSGDRLYRNDINSLPTGEGKGGAFTDVSAQAGIYQSNLGYGLGLAIADINNDGWDDIYVGNDFHENDYYYINNGPSPSPPGGGEGRGEVSFTESGAKHFRHYSRFSMGNDVADYNNDGQLDVVTLDMLPPDEKTLKTYGSDENPDIYKVKLEINGYQNQYSRNCLQRNNGNGTSFSETALLSGVSATDWSWAPLFADFDNDGNKDLFISSGIVKRPVDLDFVKFVSNLSMQKAINQTHNYDDMALEKMPDGSSHPFLFKGDGVLGFTDISKDWGTAKLKGYFNGASYADLDNDGNLDIVINCLNAPAVILKNNPDSYREKKNYISISFKGHDGLNTFGIGCKAYIFQAGKLQYQQLMLTRGFQSSSDTRLHFGLDSLTNIDSILIVWPNQNYQVLKNIRANKPLTISQQDAAGVFQNRSFFPEKKEYFEDISAQVNCQWKHKENDFFDYNVQYLIPHAQSTRGPKIAVADVNGDGLDDLYACGAKEQPGCLMIQTQDGKFIQCDTSVFSKNAASEDVDAVFFDANNDGYSDLFVVSGGNQYDDGNPNLADRLYINDGKGHFSRSENAVPQILTNKSSAAVADIDKDGDSDLFVGGLANAKKYGIPQSSYLLLNDGKGNFKQADESVIGLKNIGIVTSSSFADINNDGWTDLAVSGEWMPVKIFINSNGVFKATDIAQSTGLWQTVFTTDVNGDGFTDILAGNWGRNTKLYTGKNGPCKLYVKDFDNNGSVEQVLSYTINGKEYPFLAKDELERSLPILKKAYLTYSEVAGKTVDYMFYDLFKDYTELKAETLGSCCFINDGKGNFKKIELPEELQLAPVFSFTPSSYNNKNGYLATGNFYGTIPYEGRYDALLPTFFSFDKKTSGFQSYSNLPVADGEVRDIKWLNYSNGGKILLIARNNKELLFYRPLKTE